MHGRSEILLMPTDFRDGKTFPRRGREALGGFLWLARVFDKARAKTNQTHDGYIYPCPMDRAVMHRWGISSHEFTSAISERLTDDHILAWLSERVTPDRMRAANEWLSRRKFSLDRQDAEEGVPGAVASKVSPEIIIGLVVAALTLLVAWLTRLLHS
jgi:hypothetical protein